MPLKGSRKQHNRNNFVGKNAKNKKFVTLHTRTKTARTTQSHQKS